MAFIDLCNDYRQASIAVIPCRRVSAEHGILTGKVAAVAAWDKYCTQLPEPSEISGWEGIFNVVGLGVVLGEASDLCCIDVDTEDIEMQQRILAVLPPTPVVVLGRPGRLGKFFYRRGSITGLTKVKIGVDNRRAAVDCFFDKAYACIPPGLHSMNVDGSGRIDYQWKDGRDLLSYYKNLPVLDIKVLEALRLVIEHGQTKKEVETVLRPEQDVGRWHQITAHAGRLIRDCTELGVAVEELLKYDHDHFPDNPFFLDRSKGAKTPDARVNCIKFYGDMLAMANGHKKPGEKLELPATSRAAENYQETAWPEPESIRSNVPRPAFQPHWIPRPWKDMVLDGAAAAAVDPAMIFWYMLGTYSAVIGNRCLIRPYKNNKHYFQACNLYIGLIAKSGERKSEATGIAKTPLVKAQKKLIEEQQELMREGARVNENIAIRVKKLRLDLETEVIKHGTNSAKALEIHKEIETVEAGKVCVRDVCLIEQENTPEAFYKIAQENSQGLFIEFNEWRSAYRQMGDNTGLKLRKFIMQGHDGTDAFTYKTKHQGENLIDMLTLSCGFSTQEDVMAEVISGMAAGENDGLMQRFCLVLSDGRLRPISDEHFSVPASITDMYEAAYRLEQYDLELDSDARDLWMRFQRENQAVRSKLSSAVGSWYSKQDGLVLRLAALLAHIESLGRPVKYLGEAGIRQAIEMCHYLRDTMAAVLDLGRMSQAQEVSNMLRMGIIEDGMSTRDICRAHGRMFTNSEDVLAKLRPLVNAGHIRIEKDKKAWTIRVNPRLME